MKPFGRLSVFAGLALGAIIVLALWMLSVRRDRALAKADVARVLQAAEEYGRLDRFEGRRRLKLLDSPGPGYRGQRQQVAPESDVRANE